jgi:hypothetical protein
MSDIGNNIIIVINGRRQRMSAFFCNFPLTARDIFNVFFFFFLGIRKRPSNRVFEIVPFSKEISFLQVCAHPTIDCFKMKRFAYLAERQQNPIVVKARWFRMFRFGTVVTYSGLRRCGAAQLTRGILMINGSSRFLFYCELLKVGRFRIVSAHIQAFPPERATVTKIEATPHFKTRISRTYRPNLMSDHDSTPYQISLDRSGASPLLAFRRPAFRCRRAGSITSSLGSAIT